MELYFVVRAMIPVPFVVHRCDRAAALPGYLTLCSVYANPCTKRRLSVPGVRTRLGASAVAGRCSESERTPGGLFDEDVHHLVSSFSEVIEGEKVYPKLSGSLTETIKNGTYSV